MKRATFITWEQLKVGGMILLALAILTVAVVKLGEAANLFSKRYRLVVLLPSANGLRVGRHGHGGGAIGRHGRLDRLSPARRRHDPEPAGHRGGRSGAAAAGA
jgi:hypothetical protein